MIFRAIYQKPRLIFGCGNPLFGDDGFGAAVIEYLEYYHLLPKDVGILDAGTAIREFLLDILLLEQKPKQIIIVDAMDFEGAEPGEIREIDINEIQPAKISDFSLHQFPTVNMLKEIQGYTEISVRILVVQPEVIPDRVKPGLSKRVAAAVTPMSELIAHMAGVPVHAGSPHDCGTVHIGVGQLADRLGVHRNTVSNWIKGGKIAAQPTIGRKYAIETLELKRFFRQSGVSLQVAEEVLHQHGQASA